MEINDLLEGNHVIADFRTSSKKQALQQLSKTLAESFGIDARDTFAALMERERLGSTGVGRGVAIPHARIAGVDHIAGLFARLCQPIDFDSIDDRPVDLVFLLLAPEEAGADHLKALARVSRLLRDDAMCDRLRTASDAAAIYALLSQPASAAA
ncbi:PTS IIA-like nitrogen regulatory protein PtsN [Eilatimonas milleporae]|uniref:Phosphotransferase IIA-like nitrogen-regulatory protein PtsN n=1 Tax=Eilatimonas milleporae TaxID=911205 RepID=A0A3M0BZ98_9PROT|nr:PTS IIA-like nitrogen regulatory protein PtsN [Eilatimonas milleporae]RMB01905.1 phosphotransferase IIA-like nitrogen-regulatory protein PtsN [Eilatimonas milleporae]